MLREPLTWESGAQREARVRRAGRGMPMRVVEIADPTDPRLADYRDLTDVALRRVLEPDGGLYIAESAKVIGRALAAGHRPRSMLVQEKWLADVAGLLADAHRDAGLRRRRRRGRVAHRLRRASGRARGDAPPAARLRSPRSSRAPDRRRARGHRRSHERRRRSSAAARRSARMPCSSRPRCADPLYRRSVRVSMGTVFQVPWTRLPEWPRGARRPAATLGFHLAALALADDAVGARRVRRGPARARRAAARRRGRRAEPAGPAPRPTRS